jgi:hypothetical protein
LKIYGGEEKALFSIGILENHTLAWLRECERDKNTRSA